MRTKTFVYDQRRSGFRGASICSVGNGLPQNPLVANALNEHVIIARNDRTFAVALTVIVAVRQHPRCRCEALRWRFGAARFRPFPRRET